MVLFLNSTFVDHVDVAVTNTLDDQPAWQSVAGRDVLGAIMHVLPKGKQRFARITGITVVPGPGPFSRVRAGVTVANTIAFALGIPLFQYRDGKLRRATKPIVPHYGGEPNITKPRKR